jgi:Ca-activated chloride channel homolog
MTIIPGVLELQTPLALLLLLVLPAWWLWRRRRRPEAIVFSRASVLARGPRTGQSAARAIFVLRNVAIALLVIAVARPRSPASAQTVTTEGIDMVIAFDISSSMLAEDFRPHNRLAVAKQMTKEFIRSRSGDRIGLVAFAGEALTQVPLTTEYQILLQAVDNMQPGQVEDGTAIGTGIATAANRLRDAPGRSRVIVLVTDGVNNRGMDPMVAARAASVYGIRIHGIGVGTEGFAPVPVARGPTGLRYEMQPVQIDERLLVRIAQMTGGRYFRARDPGALSRIYEAIDQLETTRVETRTYVQFLELFRWPLALGLLALVAELAIVARRSPLP